MLVFRIKENSKKSLNDILEKLGYLQLAEYSAQYRAGESDRLENAVKRFKRKNKDFLSFLQLKIQREFIVSSGISGVIPLKFAIDKGELASLVVEPMIHWGILSEFAAVSNKRDWLDVKQDWQTSIVLDIELWYFAKPFIKEAKKVLLRPAKGYKKKTLFDYKPKANTNWNDYSINSYPYKKIIFKNTLTEISLNVLPHQLIKKAIELILKSMTNYNIVPPDLIEDIEFINKILKDVNSIEPTKKTFSKLPKTGAWGGYKYLYKELENLFSLAGIIATKNKRGCSYSIRTEKLFESFLNYLFERYALEHGMRFYSDSNDSSRIGFEKISLDNQTSMLSSFRPDIVLTSHDTLIIIDAKYKRHFDLLSSGKTKDSEWYGDFRNDIHQVVSYGIFSEKKYKLFFLAYPSLKHNSEISLWKVNRNSRIIIGLIPFVMNTKRNIEFIYKKFSCNFNKLIGNIT